MPIVDNQLVLVGLIQSKAHKLAKQSGDKKTGQDYRAYLLRAWVERGTQEDQWRFQLERPADDARKNFVNLERMMEYLAADLDMDIEDR